MQSPTSLHSFSHHVVLVHYVTVNVIIGLAPSKAHS